MLENNSCWNGLFVRNMRYEQKVTLIPVCRSLFRYVLHNALCGYCIHYMVSATKPSFIFIKFGAWINFFLKVQIKFFPCLGIFCLILIKFGTHLSIVSYWVTVSFTKISTMIAALSGIYEFISIISTFVNCIKINTFYIYMHNDILLSISPHPIPHFSEVCWHFLHAVTVVTVITSMSGL